MMRSDRKRVGVVTTSYPRTPDDPAGSFVAAHVDWLRTQGSLVDVVCAGDRRQPHQQWQDGVRIFPVWADGSLARWAGVPAVVPGLLCCSARKSPGLVCCTAKRRARAIDLFYRGGAPEALESIFTPSKSTINSLIFEATPTFAFFLLHSGIAPFNAMNFMQFMETGQKASLFSLFMAVTVAQLLDRWDAIFTHWLLPSGASTCLAGSFRLPFERSRTPLTTIAHSGDVHLIHKLGIASPVARLLRARQSKLVFVSRALKARFTSRIRNRQLIQWIEHNSMITPMGIDIHHFDRLRQTAIEDTESNRPFRILFIGRLVPIKGVDVLLQALIQPAFKPQTPVHLTIAGDGPSRPALERIAASNSAIQIEFTGEVGAPRRDQLLTRADVLVIPSLPRPDGRTEGMPVTALEAMASGTPLIASRTGGLADLPAHVATLIPPGDRDALATALTSCARAPHRFKQLADAAARYVERFSWAHVGPRLWPDAPAA